MATHVEKRQADPLVEMQRMIARMPDDERRFRIGEVLDMLYTMPLRRARKIMREVASARAKLDAPERRILREAQERVVAGYPARKKRFLMAVEKDVMRSVKRRAA